MKRIAGWLIVLTLILNCFPALALEGETIHTGARGDQVARLQARLVELGFLDGAADGIYGPKTEAAVRAFRALLLERSGADPSKASGKSIGAEDLQVLYADPFSFYVSDIQIGDQGSAVSRLQSALIRLNYLDDKDDGYFGENTRAGVQYFQSLNGLAQTGVADKATQDLLASGADAAARPAYKVVKKGDEGASVRAIQRRLIGLGLLNAPEDGFYGSDTVNALARLREYLEALGDAFVVEDAEEAPIELQRKLDSDIPAFVAALSSGAKNAGEVRRLQRRLNALDYIGRMTIDGKLRQGHRRRHLRVSSQQRSARNGRGRPGDPGAVVLGRRGGHADPLPPERQP